MGRWLYGTAVGLGTILLGLAGIVGFAIKGDQWGYWPLMLTLAALLLVAWKWIGVMSESFRVTRERIVVRRGIIMKSVDEIELYRVKDVRMDFSLLNQLAGIGTITVTSSDETTRNTALSMQHVAHAQERREGIRKLVDAARRERGVREIDMALDQI
nr:PH domain-containing protein [Parerythrobacter lacustris]